MKKAKDGDDAAEIRRLSEELTNAAQTLGRILYEQAAQQQAAADAAGPAGAADSAGPGPQPGSGPQPETEQKKDEGVVDADFEVVDDDKDKDK